MGAYAFFEGRVVPVEEAKISVMTHAFNYGTGVFEGIRAYWCADEGQLNVFKLAEHYQRLLRSVRILKITLPYSVTDLVDLTVDVLRRSAFREDTYIRPVAYKSSAVVGVRLHNLEDSFTLFALPFGRYVDKADGAHCCVSSWRRNDDNAIPSRCKITGSYVNSALSKSEAVEDGYDEAIVLNQDGHVSEGSAENLFIVRDGVLITPPSTDNILEGITRGVILQLAQAELGIPTLERSIDRSELYLSDECFLCGTGGEILPVTQIDRRLIGDGRVGSVTAQVRKQYFDIVRAINKKYSGWLTPVYIK
jgi:branched-chain amino acid aminotransferase